MAGVCVRREKAALSSECEPHRQGVWSDLESEGHEEKYRAVVTGATCAVNLYPASRTSSWVSFNTIDRKTGNKVDRR